MSRGLRPFQRMQHLVAEFPRAPRHVLQSCVNEAGGRADGRGPRPLTKEQTAKLYKEKYQSKADFLHKHRMEEVKRLNELIGWDYNDPPC